MKTRKIDVDKGVTFGDGALTFIAGPCVIESRKMAFDLAERLSALADKLKVKYIFKASFDKANRTSVDSYRGPGIEEGLDIDGWPIRIVDTAGLRATDDAIEAEGVVRAEELMAKADIVVALDCDIVVAKTPNNKVVTPALGFTTFLISAPFTMRMHKAKRAITHPITKKIDECDDVYPAEVRGNA